MPGVRSPRRSAPEIIASAMRSLYDPVGLPASSLTHTSAWPGGTTRVNGNTGVSPMPDRAEVPGGLIGAIIAFRRPEEPRGAPGRGAHRSRARQQDLRASRTQGFTDGELFYAIEPGIPWTGMPAWTSGTDEGERDRGRSWASFDTCRI